VASDPPLGSFKLEIKKGNKTITEVTLSLIVPISFCQVSHPPFSIILDPPLLVLTLPHCVKHT